MPIQPFAEEAFEAGEGGVDMSGLVPGVLADEDPAVVGEGDPGGDAEMEHGVAVAGDARVGVAQVDGDRRPNQWMRRTPLVVQ